MNKSLIGIERALIVKQPHISRILDGSKTLEMRRTGTNVRGRIGLIEQGTGLIVGTCIIENSFYFLPSDLPKHFKKHCIDYEEHPEFKIYCHGWELSNAKAIKPVPYKHPMGAVIFVRSEAWDK